VMQVILYSTSITSTLKIKTDIINLKHILDSKGVKYEEASVQASSDQFIRLPDRNALPSTPRPPPLTPPPPFCCLPSRWTSTPTLNARHRCWLIARESPASPNSTWMAATWALQTTCRSLRTGVSSMPSWALTIRRRQAAGECRRLL
jgi:hypothetical protein